MITIFEEKFAILEEENKMIKKLLKQALNKLIDIECKYESVIEILDINNVVDREMIESMYDHIKQETDFKNSSLLK